MQGNILSHAEQYVKKRKWRKIWHRIVSVLACVVVFCTTYALILPVITSPQISYCGIEDHQHSDSCYEMRPVDERHKSNDSVYSGDSVIRYKKVLICKKEEHCHSLSCYSNPNADLETASDWKSDISDIKLTGNRADDLIAIAESQLGYTESKKITQLQNIVK